MVEEKDILIVGAGPAGIGLGVALQKISARFGILERAKTGASFRRWPQETRMITPSFTSNAFNLPDLNALTPETSPAYSLGREHPSGREYARSLEALARHYELPVVEGTRVTKVARLEGTEGFLVHTNRGLFRSRFLVWAVGEFSFPHWPFEGAQHGLPYSRVRSWGSVEGQQQVIIGGYESGIDAAYHLVMLGKEVMVFDPKAPWKRRTGEPSLDLSPFTLERLQKALDTRRLSLVELGVERIEKKRGGYLVHHTHGVLQAPHRPILAAGFGNGLEPLEGLLEVTEGRPLLSEKDESTVARGLFLVGPKVNHHQTAFCFIYKFRARFPVVALEIGQRLGLDTSPLEAYRKRGMWADDLEACCTSRCVC
jgi:putative flavoprotein involved in K+ transport